MDITPIGICLSGFHSTVRIWKRGDDRAHAESGRESQCVWL